MGDDLSVYVSCPEANLRRTRPKDKGVSGIPGRSVFAMVGWFVPVLFLDESG